MRNQMPCWLVAIDRNKMFRCVFTVIVKRFLLSGKEYGSVIGAEYIKERTQVPRAFLTYQNVDEVLLRSEEPSPPGAGFSFWIPLGS